MKFTYYGHSCFSVKIDGKSLLFDPFITPNELAGHINVDEIQADYILISHGHGDHVADVESIAKRTGAKVISNYEIVEWFAKKGVENGHPMNLGGSVKLGWGKIKSVIAHHSSTLPDGASGGHAGGFVVESQEGNFYFAGDTALTLDMKLIGEHFKLDFAVLPVGDNFTMDAYDAVKCAEFINCNNIIAVHFDTFPYIKIEKEEVKKAFEKTGKKLYIPEIGEEVNTKEVFG